MKLSYSWNPRPKRRFTLWRSLPAVMIPIIALLCALNWAGSGKSAGGETVSPPTASQDPSTPLAVTASEESVAPPASPTLPVLPSELPPLGTDGVYYLNTPTGRRALTLNPAMQDHLTKFIADRGLPIASAMVVEVATGHILAMVQGRPPQEWGAKSHTALYSGFPAASVFKTVSTAAALEIADVDENRPVGLVGGCGHVGLSGVWFSDVDARRRNEMTLRRAFGHSCNGFFAKMAVNNLGLGLITKFARKFRWGSPVPADFATEASPLHPPSPQNSSASTVGRFAAGFGFVGLSPAHASWVALTVARDGRPIPLSIFRDTPAPTLADPIISVETAQRLRQIMAQTTQAGTATHAFRPRRYRKVREFAGGKTGTLTGHAPQGLTTWFTGMMPLDKPKVVVAAVVVLDGNRWQIKGTNLAAEAFWAYDEFEGEAAKMATAGQLPAANVHH